MKKILILSLILIFFTSTSFAELISLKDGSTVTGKIDRDNGEEITLNDGKKTFVIPWDGSI